MHTLTSPGATHLTPLAPLGCALHRAGAEQVPSRCLQSIPAIHPPPRSHPELPSSQDTTPRVSTCDGPGWLTPLCLQVQRNRGTRCHSCHRGCPILDTWRSPGATSCVTLEAHGAVPAEEMLESGRRAGHSVGGGTWSAGEGRTPPAQRVWHGAGRPSGVRYLVLLLAVQLLGVCVRLPNQRVHQHQEGHVEQQGPHGRQVDDDDDLGRDRAL